jgi:hypothetical protein
MEHALIPDNLIGSSVAGWEALKSMSPARHSWLPGAELNLGSVWGDFTELGS